MSSKKPKGLGKGLSALFGDQKRPENKGKIDSNAKKALIGELVRNKYQPRTIFDENKIEELSQSIKKKWNKRDIQEAIIYLSKIDKICKINSGVNALTIIQNSITNLCSRSWTYF